MKTEGPSNQYRAHRSSVGIVFTTSNRDLYVNYVLEKDVSSNCMERCLFVKRLGI